MARTLEELQKRYQSTPKGGPGGRGPMPGGPRGPMGRGPMGMGASGKPKSTKKTLVRLLGYIKGYRILLLPALLCLLISTLSTLSATLRGFIRP